MVPFCKSILRLSQGKTFSIKAGRVSEAEVREVVAPVGYSQGDALMLGRPFLRGVDLDADGNGVIISETTLPGRVHVPEETVALVVRAGPRAEGRACIMVMNAKKSSKKI